ncbi:protein kinase domain-containing protein [Sorangium sp. So ce1128]
MPAATLAVPPIVVDLERPVTQPESVSLLSVPELIETTGSAYSVPEVAGSEPPEAALTHTSAARLDIAVAASTEESMDVGTARSEGDEHTVPAPTAIEQSGYTPEMVGALNTTTPSEVAAHQRVPTPVSVNQPGPAVAMFAPDAAPRTWEAAEPQSFQGLAAWDALAIATIVRAEPALDGILQASDPHGARRQRIACIEAEIERLRADLAAVPDDSRIIEGDELRRRISDLGARVASNPPSQVRVHGPVALEELLAALVDEAVHNLPYWALEFDIDDDAGRAHVLTDPSLQARLLGALAWVRRRFAGAPPDRLRSVSMPDSGGRIEDMLEAAWTNEETLSAAAGTLPAPCLSLLRALPSTQIPEVVEALYRWFGALDPIAFEELVATIAADPAELHSLLDLRRLDTISADDREILKDLRTIEKARKFLDRARIALPPAPAPPLNSARAKEAGAKVLDFGHVLTDDRGKIVAASIVVPPPDQRVGVVLLGVPLRIISDGVILRELSITVTSPALTAVSRDAVLPTSVQIRSIPNPNPSVNTKFELQWKLPADEARWRPIEPGRFSREEVLPIPVTLGEATRLRDGKAKRISLTISSGDASATLHLESFLTQMPELTVRTGVGTASATDLVRGRPLGAQVQHEKLEGVISEGRLSFMVVAPRRFGKTTLFLHLAEHARAKGHEVVQISLERDLSPEQGVQKVWDGLRRAFEERFDASPALGDSLPRTLTDEMAWTAVRRFVREKTQRSLVVLIDEAQALVPRYGGQRWGNQFKNFIERFLFEPSDRMACAQLGLFGTVDLAVRIGQNCRDFLLMHGTEQYAFDEASLARFLRTVGQGAILSSKAARLELASWTSNLRTLNSVFDGVRARIVQQQQVFMLDVDVHASIADILSADAHRAEEIWTYARAELSHRDEWEPVDSFPLAVAWSRPELSQMPQSQRLEDCVRWLSAELTASGASGWVPTERVESSLRDLKARGVLRDDGEFYRPLLRELLRRRPQVLRQDRDSQMALLRLAVDDVEWPEQAEQRDEGGEARIFIQSRGDRTLAYRACKLDGDENRRRFARTCAAIRTLRDRRTKMPGDDHLPRVIEAGFRRDDASEGIIVYEWVEGETFEALWPKLPVQGRAHVVRQVAMAVAALHARDVIHCDVAPRNIIVNGRLDATLIDFGLARRADQLTHTRLARDPFKAPEQCEDPPSVDKASDVYALAILLRGPDPKVELKPTGLCELVAKMTSERIEDRPSIVEVVRHLDELVDFEPILHQIQTKVEDVVNDAPEWLWEDLLHFAGNATLVHGGYLPWGTQRAMESAFLLNNLFVRIVAEKRGSVASKLATCGGGDELSLAALRGKIKAAGDRSLHEWECREVKAIGLMRIAWAHPKDRSTRITEAMRVLSSREATFHADLRRAVVKVAGMLDKLTDVGGCQAITRFVEFFTCDK